MSNPSRRQPGIEAFTVFPSTGSQIIFSIVFLFFFLIPYIVTFIGRDGELLPAWIMLFSFYLLGVSYVACTRVANAFIRFGTELYEYSLFRPNLLWPVALRLYAIPLVTILVVIPVAGSLLIGTAKSWTIPQSILLGASSSMLLLFLMVGTVYYAISPESNRVVRTIVSVLFFPMKFMGAVLPGVVILAILMAILQSVFPLLNEVSVRTSSAIAYKLEALSTVPLIGPLLLFYLNPWYLLCLIYTSPDPSMQTGTALFIVLSLATGLMLFRLKLWLEVDLDEHALRVYDEWVEVRSKFASTAEKEYGTSSSDMPDSELPTANGQSQARAGASPTLSKLRGDLGSPKPLKNGESNLSRFCGQLY